MRDPEFQQNFSGRYFGTYRGFVTDNNDPQKLGRVKVKVPSVLGSDEELGWAFPKPVTGGGKNAGDLWIPAQNDYVWVEFEDGMTDYPLWSPGPWAFRAGSSTVPNHSRGDADLTDYSVREVGNVPPTQFEGVYPNVRTIQGYDGSFLEFDATSGSERVQLSHYTGSRIEFAADGSVVNTGIANVTDFVTGKYSIQVGSEDKLIKSERNLQVEGVVQETFLANVTRTYNTLNDVGKTYTGTWEGDWNTVTSGQFNVVGSGNGALSFAGQLAFMVGANLQMSVMETIELTASAATTGEQPLNPLGSPLPAVNVHGYNGQAIFKATDVTGQAKECSLTHDPIVAGTANSKWEVSLASIPGGQITLEETPASPAAQNVLLGAGSARQPVAMGNNLVDFLSQLWTFLLTHTHPSGTGPTGPSAELATAATTINGVLNLPPGPTSIKSMYSATS